MVVPFKNEPGIDFSVQENVERFQKTLEKVKRFLLSLMVNISLKMIHSIQLIQRIHLN